MNNATQLVAALEHIKAIVDETLAMMKPKAQSQTAKEIYDEAIALGRPPPLQWPKLVGDFVVPSVRTGAP